MLPIRIISLFCKPGRFGQWIAIVTVSLCALTASMGFAWPSGALPKIRRGEAGFSLDLNEQSWIVTSLFIGNIVSPLPSAYMMECLGRRNSLCITIWLHVISFIIILAMPGFWPIFVAKVLQGFWIGLVYTVVPVYIGECADPSIRGILGTFYGVFLYIGSLSISLVGSFFSYQTLNTIPIIVTTALAVLLCLIPESPYYYLAYDKIDAARSSLSWLRGYCDETVLNSIKDSIQKNKKQNSSFYDVVKAPGTRKGFMIVLLLGSIQRSSGLAILLTFVSITMPDYIVSAEEFTIVLNVVWIVSCILSGFVMDKFGRKTMMGFSCTGSSLTMLGVAIWFYLRDQAGVDVSSFTWLPFALLIIHGVAYSFGIVSIPTMMPGEIFSTEIKSKASSLVSIWVALVSGFILNIYIPLQINVGNYINFLICAISSFIGILSAIFIMIETRGKTLEDIQDELEGNKTKKEIIESTRF